MIACVDCGRVLLEVAAPSLMSTREHKAHVAAQVRTARNLHTCKSTGGFMPTNDHCDTVAALVEQGTTTLEEAASVIGCPAPSLHIHLVQHDRDDLLRRLTYGGEPILEPVAAEPVTAEPEADEPEVEERSCQCDKWEFDPGEDDFEEPNDDGTGTIVHTEQACYQREPVPAAIEVPEEWADEVETLTQAEAEDRPSLDDLVHPEPEDSLAWLCGHEDREIRDAAVALKMLLVKRNFDRRTKAEIERLTVERDHMTARIEELQAALFDQPTPPRMVAVAEPEPTGEPTTSEIRAWCVANDVPVPSRGTLPRAAIEAYDAAHEVSA